MDEPFFNFQSIPSFFRFYEHKNSNNLCSQKQVFVLAYPSKYVYIKAWLIEWLCHFLIRKSDIFFSGKRAQDVWEFRRWRGEEGRGRQVETYGKALWKIKIILNWRRGRQVQSFTLFLRGGEGGYICLVIIK